MKRMGLLTGKSEGNVVRPLFLIVFCVVLGCICVPVYAQQTGSAGVSVSSHNGAMDPAEENEQWRSVDIGNIKVFYRPDADLRSMKRKLRLRGRLPVLGYLKPAEDSAPEDKIAYRISVIFKRVKNILDMYPRIKEINIRVFDSQEALDEAYYAILGERRTEKSFYIHKYSTIYTTEKNMIDSILAHEMGHAVVDHYFVIRPPERVREILSSYVDLHLDG